MNTVGRIGSYISLGVNTVSGPFHPFGGAVDIIVVEQPDGSFKTSPWYVRFGKFQGVLKTKEKVVNISVNGVEANFHMYLNHKGEAYFLREVDEKEEEESVLYPLSSGDETDGQSNSNRRPTKSKSCNFDSDKSNSADRNDVSNGMIVARTSSRRSRILGLVFGRRSIKEDSYREGEGSAGIIRVSSMESAEIAANLLEVKWSTNLASRRRKKDNSSRFLAPEMLDGMGDKDMQNDNAKGVFSEITAPDSQIPFDNEVCPSEQFDEGVNEESGSDKVQSFVYCETSESSIVGLDGSNEQACETLYLASGGRGEVHVLAETLHATTELLCEDTVIEQAEDIELETRHVEVSENNSQQTNPSLSCIDEYNKVELKEPVAVSESSTHIVGIDPTLGSIEEVKSQSICAISCFSNSGPVEDEKNNRNDLQPALKSVGDSQYFYGDYVPTKAVSIPSSESSEEEQFVFSDLGEFKVREVQHMGSISPDCIIKDLENSIEKSRVISSSIKIPRVDGEEAGWLGGSLPNMWPHIDNLDVDGLGRPLSHSLDSNSMSSKWTLLGKGESSCKKSDADKGSQLALEQRNNEDTQISGELKSVVNPAVGDTSKAIISPGGSWGLWPFSFKRSRSRTAMQPAPGDARSSTADNASESTIGTVGDKNVLQSKVVRKMVRTKTPTSEQLASMNLKEGSNTITFTFSTAMLGKQQVDARIYLWKWNTRIVISDVDGTITKSDVLGQFMPLVGVDWSQTGVAHLFSAIKENGYQLIFLSARAISQASNTRQFLVNLKQDGKALPDGPIVISPDGLFPSLFREVIRRAPHEFKIACLEDIKALFPSDCNPFYAGFGNRDTDEISYLKVGIPKGKIFIINPKGEVAVNRRVDTKSYSSLHALVHGMFPPKTSSEQEDFNSWNFWKLPPPVMDF